MAPAMWFSSYSTRVRASTTVKLHWAGGVAAVRAESCSVLMKVSGASSARKGPAAATAADATIQIFILYSPRSKGRESSAPPDKVAAGFPRGQGNRGGRR